jgi:hypothetical protein
LFRGCRGGFYERNAYFKDTEVKKYVLKLGAFDFFI